MKPLDEHFEHQLLDHFTYDTRTDDGYGPDHPRVGYRCARSFPNVGQRVFFRIEREPNTGLQSVIDAIGEHYLYTAREYGWLDTEVRDMVYVETKQRGWCQE